MNSAFRAAPLAFGWGLALAGALDAVPASSQPADSATSVPVAATPFVPGGFDDKPYLRGLFGRIAVGGYIEAHGAWERGDGVTDELGFELERWNLLAHTRVSEAVHIWSEVEIEDAGREVRLELAQLDVRLHPAFNVRAGMLLSPLGRFNLAHDAPRNPFTARPLVATGLLGVALSEPGAGAFGALEWGGGRRLTYELYAVNGFGDGVVGSSEGTRVSSGRGNFEDQNSSPAVVGRLAMRPWSNLELGVSAHHGAWNVFQDEGLVIDDRRDLTIGVLDGEATVWSLTLRGEGALVAVEVPAGLAGLYADHQAGFYMEAVRPFARGWFHSDQGSEFAAAVRVDAVDFDRALRGDSRRALSLGLNVRPTAASVIKLDYERSEERDRFNNLSHAAGLRLGVASYF